MRVTPCNARVERPVKVQSKTNVPETEVIKATDTRTENHEIAHNFEKGEEKGIEIQNLNMIIDLGNGETTTIVATVLPSNASDKTVTYKSDNPSIATIDNNGIVTGKGVGRTTITITSNGGGTPATTIINVK